MSNETLIYPFDPTGQAGTNEVTDEYHNLVIAEWSQHLFIIPKAAPFFSETMSVQVTSTGKYLKEGVDWVPGYKFLDASRSTGKSIYGSIVFLNRENEGNLSISYQTLGGEWLISESNTMELLSNALVNPRISSWEQVVQLPERFPVINHLFDLVDMVGMSEVKDAIDALTAALIERGNPSALIQTHIRNKNNPHNVNANDIGLSNVNNYGMANTEDAILGERSDCYMSPLTTKQMIDRYSLTPEAVDQKIATAIDQLRQELS